MTLTHAALLSALSYEPLSGNFRWRERALEDFASEGVWKLWNKRWAGKIAGRVDASGYRAIGLRGRRYKAHRLAWFYVHGTWPKLIDHINGHGDDNRLQNPRDVSHPENNRNTRRRSDNHSGTTGVHWSASTNKWEAGIRVGGRRYYLGVYADQNEAIEVRQLAAEMFGFHQNHGKPV